MALGTQPSCHIAHVYFGGLLPSKIPPESTLIFDIEIMEIRNEVGIRGLYTRQGLYLKKEFERHGYPANDTRHEAMVEDGLISSREFTYKHDEL
uniref:FKBP prolyl isomerase 14 n=1 Tax=Hucho hucho TaxID=62062 RepID=A0A4W5PFW4_9TELE